MDKTECLAEFRVQKQDIPVLANVLQLPMNIRCPQRTIWDRIEGLCMLLRRFSYPCRYSDMITRFGRPVPELCMITNEVMDNIFNNHGHRISQRNDDVLSLYLLQEYADVIHAKGPPLENCFRFIDGTVRPIARPDQHQRIVYNDYKLVHSLKFQSVALPNGLIGNMFGPVGMLVTYIYIYIYIYISPTVTGPASAFSPCLFHFPTKTEPTGGGRVQFQISTLTVSRVVVCHRNNSNHYY